jgi:hypothetical protein
MALYGTQFVVMKSPGNVSRVIEINSASPLTESHSILGKASRGLDNKSFFTESQMWLLFNGFVAEVLHMASEIFTTWVRSEEIVMFHDSLPGTC